MNIQPAIFGFNQFPNRNTVQLFLFWEFPWQFKPVGISIKKLTKIKFCHQQNSKTKP